MYLSFDFTFKQIAFIYQKIIDKKGAAWLLFVLVP